MDSLDWLLSAIDDPDAIRLNAILLVYLALVGVLLIVRQRGQVPALPRRTVRGRD
jgi:hypothetical protein